MEEKKVSLRITQYVILGNAGVNQSKKEKLLLASNSRHARFHNNNSIRTLTPNYNNSQSMSSPFKQRKLTILGNIQYNHCNSNHMVLFSAEKLVAAVVSSSVVVVRQYALSPSEGSILTRISILL